MAEEPTPAAEPAAAAAQMMLEIPEGADVPKDFEKFVKDGKFNATAAASSAIETRAKLTQLEQQRSAAATPDPAPGINVPKEGETPDLSSATLDQALTTVGLSKEQIYASYIAAGRQVDDTLFAQISKVGGQYAHRPSVESIVTSQVQQHESASAAFNEETSRAKEYVGGEGNMNSLVSWAAQSGEYDQPALDDLQRRFMTTGSIMGAARELRAAHAEFVSADKSVATLPSTSGAGGTGLEVTQQNRREILARAAAGDAAAHAALVRLAGSPGKMAQIYA